ncbi:hypothetical protein NDU88_009375 [Pleurodeles waltl]|uniref:Uncharacterized protein n=1 Tax=Pleurodeles waltl TaxID=8319 RepID=A0AAV7PUR8_PLEWA|nr:hypothetical protein NDU88_009375 [Pleurodeles waltl]
MGQGSASAVWWERCVSTIQVGGPVRGGHSAGLHWIRRRGWDHLSPRGMSQGLKLVQLSLSWRTHDESMGPGVPAGAGQRRPWAIPGLTPVFLALSVSPRVQAPGSSGPLPPVAPPLSFPFQRRCASVLHIFGGRGGAADDLLWRGRGPPRFVANDQQSQAPGYRPSRLPLIGVR